MTPGRRPVGRIVFLGLWLVAWLAAILIALVTLGRSALGGEAGAAIVLALWVGAACFGLIAAARRLFALLTGEVSGQARRPPSPRHAWNDGMPTGAAGAGGRAAGRGRRR